MEGIFKDGRKRDSLSGRNVEIAADACSNGGLLRRLEQLQNERVGIQVHLCNARGNLLLQGACLHHHETRRETSNIHELTPVPTLVGSG